MIKKDVEPESIIILIKSLSSSLIPPISKYHCRMPSPCFEIQIAQLSLNFIFNYPLPSLTSPPPPLKKKSNRKYLLLGQSLLSYTPTRNSRAEDDWAVGKNEHSVIRIHDLLIEDTNA